MGMLTVKQVAARLNVSAACVYGLAERGILVGYKIGVGRGTWRFNEEDVSSFLAAVRSPAADEAASSIRPLRRTHSLFEHLDGEKLRKAWRNGALKDAASQASD